VAEYPLEFVSDEWVHSRDYSLWLSLRTGAYERFDARGNLIGSGTVGQDTDAGH
jgi:hypothetical protein